MIRKLAMMGVIALVACGGEPLADVGSPAPALSGLEYRFVVSSVGRSAQALDLTSVARGRVTLTVLDDPPLLVGSLIVSGIELRTHERVLANVGPGEWPFLARRGEDGAADALWFEEEMPDEAMSLLRFLIGELQAADPGVEERREPTPTGVLEAGYTQGGLPWLSLGFRMRRSLDSSIVQVEGGGVFSRDSAGVRRLASGQRTRVTLDVGDEFGSSTILFARRVSLSTLADADVLRLRKQIERLSATPPVSLVEQPLSREQKDAMRREAESWDSVKTRLLSAGDPVDPTVLGRAAAYLIEDDALTRELLALVHKPSTPRMGVTAILEAFGECGTRECQDGLLDVLELDEELATACLAGLTHVAAPTSETVDRVLELCDASDELTRASVGIVLARFAEHNAEEAATRVRDLVDGLDGCPAALERWFGLLGNAGSAAARDTLLDCLEETVPVQRRAAAAAALRRVPGEGLTGDLVELIANEPGVVRRAGLRALFSREVSDEDLGVLARARVGVWAAPELNSLLDVIERVADPGEVARALAAEIGRSKHEEVAVRAQLLLDHLSR